MDVSDDDELFISLYEDGKVYIWDLQNYITKYEISSSGG